LLQLVQAAAASGLDARLLVLELRHGTASPDLPALAALRSAGVRLALDRFGAEGSPEHLREFAYDEVKVDLSWAKGEDPAARGPALALGLRELARVMRVACVGAGVETPEQLGLLRGQGWDQVQGDAVGAPLPGLEFAARWLARSGQRQRAPWSGRS
jgi:EAL domain-containing protein (putative c-di-GMP-specific phosphodiesterase class I)